MRYVKGNGIVGREFDSLEALRVRCVVAAGGRGQVAARSAAAAAVERDAERLRPRPGLACRQLATLARDVPLLRRYQVSPRSYPAAKRMVPCTSTPRHPPTRTLCVCSTSMVDRGGRALDEPDEQAKKVRRLGCLLIASRPSPSSISSSIWPSNRLGTL